MMAYELLLPSNVHVPALFRLLKHNDPSSSLSVVFAPFTSRTRKDQGPRAPLPSRRSHLDSSGSDDVQTSRRDVRWPLDSSFDFALTSFSPFHTYSKLKRIGTRTLARAASLVEESWISSRCHVDGTTMTMSPRYKAKSQRHVLHLCNTGSMSLELYCAGVEGDRRRSVHDDGKLDFDGCEA